MKHRNDTIASSLAISFASLVVWEATRRPRQLMDEPKPPPVRQSIRSPPPSDEKGVALFPLRRFSDDERRGIEMGKGHIRGAHSGHLSKTPIEAGGEIREIGLVAACTGAGLAAHLVRERVKLPHGRKSLGVSDARHCDAKADSAATSAKRPHASARHGAM